MVKGKGGWLRIVEASLAVLIVAGVILIVLGNTQMQQQTDLTGKADEILNSIAKDNGLRENILSYDLSNVNSAGNNIILNNLSSFVGSQINRRDINYSIVLCLPDELCSLNIYPSDKSLDIFASDRIISTTPYSTNFKPVKIKLYLWNVG